MSNLQTGFSYIKDNLSKLITKDTKSVIILWSFPVELESKTVRNFLMIINDDNKYSKYIEPLLELGLAKKCKNY